MPDIKDLLEKSSTKKFKKSSYRPWNYMDEIQKEEEEKQHQEAVNISDIVDGHKHSNDEANNFPKLELKQDSNGTNELNIKKLEVSIETQPQNQQLSNIGKKEKTNDSTVSPLYSILRLSGHQKTIFSFILERCISRGTLSSGVITGETLISITGTSLPMVNTSIQRLVEKNLIYRENGKRGRGGFYCFGISQAVKDSAMEYRRLATIDNPNSSRVVDIDVENYDVSRTDLRRQPISILPKEWDEIDFEPLQNIGFSRNHIVQLYKQGDLDAQSIQDSIYHFSYDLKYNNKSSSITKTSPIGYFMGILKRSTVYNAPENYESPKNRALRELLERKKSEKEKREEMIKELINISFDEWHDKLTQEEKDKLIPDDVKKGRYTTPKIASLKSYFIENVWPSLALIETDIK